MLLNFNLLLEVLCSLILSFWVSVTRHAQSNQNKFTYLCNISIKAWGIKLIFCVQIKTEVFYNMAVPLWVNVVSHAQSTQNNKFTISLQYFNENVKDEPDFLPADKRRRLFQSDTIILGKCGQVCPNYPK